MDPSLLTELGEVFDSYNTTELYQVCISKGLRVSPGWTRKKYIEALVTEEADSYNVADELRDALIAFIDRYWTQLRAQLTCPAKDMRHHDPEKVNPKPCYGCSDMQVITCVAKQSENNLIKINRLRKKNV